LDAHEWFTKALERARAKGANQFPDQVEFVRIARWNSETFEDLPELAPTWEALRQGGVSLTSLRQQWSDAQWRAIEVLTQREAQG
jgi:CelD/BcsL family acetyltransferase involved in cellulose biosynthesis